VAPKQRISGRRVATRINGSVVSGDVNGEVQRRPTAIQEVIEIVAIMYGIHLDAGLVIEFSRSPVTTVGHRLEDRFIATLCGDRMRRYEERAYENKNRC
jgi:hypothetical protein